jgi:hypothetical protein
MGRGTRG